MAHEIKGNIAIILKLCIESFSENAYIFDYNERSFAGLESTNVLQEEYDENLSLGMHMHPIEEQENEEWDPPPSPSKDDSNSKTQISMVIDENPCYYVESNDAPLLMLASTTSSKIIDDRSVVKYVV